jgi:hypothetical protein
MTTHIRLGILTTALTLTGCGGGTTDVSGKVTYQGKAVVYGTVVVLDDGGTPKSGVIQPDGTYRVNGVKPGRAKAAITSLAPPGSDGGKKRDARERGDDDKPPPPGSAPAPPEVLKAWFPIPDRYADPAKSELTVDVKPGQPTDFDLK